MPGLKLETNVITGIDLAGKPKKPTGLALWKNKKVETKLTYIDNEIFESITHNKPAIVAIDVPLSFPKKGVPRNAHREMIRRGCHVFSSRLPAMEKLTVRAIKLNDLMSKEGYKTIQVHPTSSRKVSSMPSNDWKRIQAILQSTGLGADLKVLAVKSHEIDAVIAALTAYLYMNNQAEALGDEGEEDIIIPKKQDWRAPQL